MKHCLKIRRWFLSYTLQGLGISSLSIIISLFVITRFQGSVQDATTAAALYSLGSLLGSVFVGHYLDKTENYNQIIFWGLSLSSFLTFALPFSANLPLYLLLVLLLGSSTALVNPSIILFLHKNRNESEYRKSVNILNLMNSIGLTAGTFLGGSLLMSHLPSAYKSNIIFILGAILFTGAALISKPSLIPAVNKKGSHRRAKLPRSFLSLRPIFAEFRLLPRKIPSTINLSYYSKEIIIYLLGIFVAFFGANLFFTPFSIYLKQCFHLSEGIILMIFGFSSIATTIAYLFTHKTMKKFRDFHIMRTVLFIRFFAFLAIILFSYWHSLIATVITFIVIGFTWPFLYLPATIQITQLAHPENKGRVLGLFNVVISIATISASLLSGIIIKHWGYLLNYFIAGILLLIGERIVRYVAILVPSPVIKLRRNLSEVPSRLEVISETNQ